MVVSCLRALEQAAPHTDRSIQLLGLPLMEVHLLRTIGTLDDHHLAPLDDADPDLSFAASLASATADHLTATLSSAVDHGVAAPARRLRFAATTMAPALAAAGLRPDARRVGKECVRTCGSRWW